MAINARLILLLLAFLVFVLAALGIRHPKADLLAAGLALWILSTLLA